MSPNDYPIFTTPSAARPLDGHEVLPLDEPDRCWLIEAGEVEVFYRTLADEAGLGGRHFLLSLGPGRVLFPMAEAAGLRLLAVGLGATLAPFDVADLEASGHDDLHTFYLDEWVRALAGSLDADVPSGRIEALRTGETGTLRNGQVAHVAGRTGWIRLVGGAAALLGDADLPVPDAAWLPLTEPLWLQAAAPDTVLDVRDTRSVLEDGTAPTSLAAFHRLALRRVAAQAAAAVALERTQLQHKAALEEHSLHRALHTLSGLLEVERATLPFAGLDHDDPLLAACQLIGRTLGVTMQVPPKNRPGRQAPDAVAAIAEASKVRVRPVMLRHGWWREDNGPLLAHWSTDAGERPVALLQERPTRYRLYDPADQTVRPVTAEVAAQLKPAAHMFVAPFDAEVLTARRLWRFATRGMRREGRTIAGAGLGAALLGLAVPIVSKLLFDEVIPLADRGQLLEVGLLLVVFAFVAAAFTLVRGLTMLRLEARAELQVEAALMDRLLRLPAVFFKRFQAGDLTERILGVSKMRRILTESAFSSAIGGVFSFVNLGLLFYFDARLALLGLGLAAVAFAAIFVSGLYTVHYNRQIHDWMGKISGETLQFMIGIGKLRVAGAERRAFTQWAEKFAAQKRLAYKAGTVQNNFEIFNAAYPIFTSIVFFAAVHAFTLETEALAAGGLPATDALTTGSFIAVITAFGQFLAGTLGLGMALISVLEVTVLYERARPILEARPEVRADSKDPGTLQGEVEVSHVTFRYDEHGPLILNDVSLHVQPGEMVALVGASGSGKSTLFRLLLGLEQPASGSIYFDGQDLATLDVEAVRRQIGTVLQSDTLRPGSLFKNIVGTSATLTLDDAWEAARLAGLDADIEAMPMGMHTVVGEGSSTFSGGQQQRLMIARALIHRPRLLLFDEATSALDNRTQQIVSDSLARLRVTRIVIAHRLSTIRDADRIYVLDAGRVVEVGSYASLVAADGIFAQLARRQLVRAAG